MSRAHQGMMPKGQWSALRRAVFMRDRWLCQRCGTPGRALECDHVVPLAKGGDHSMANLQTLCRECHIEKTRSEKGEIVPRSHDWDRFMGQTRYGKARP